MRHLRLNNWSNIKALEGLLLFAQSVDEMLFDYSIDSYKPPALNSHTLCWEFMHLIDINKTINFSTVKPIIDELKNSLSTDIVAIDILADRHDYLCKLLASADDIHKTEHVINLISMHFDEVYIEKTKSMLINSVKNPQKKKKYIF